MCIFIFSTQFEKTRKKKLLKSLFKVGTCGMHTVHDALRHGVRASGWCIDKILSSTYKMLDPSPSQSADYENVSKSDVYSLQFCSHRWVENKIAAERDIDVWENIVKTQNQSNQKKITKAVETCLSLSKINFNYPSCHKRATDVNPSIPIKIELSDLNKSGKISDTQFLKLKSDVASFLSALSVHLVEKLPTKYSRTIITQCFIPNLLVEAPENQQEKIQLPTGSSIYIHCMKNETILKS